jgi:Cellulase (glycosyl hydrolase family 5)
VRRAHLLPIALAVATVIAVVAAAPAQASRNLDKAMLGPFEVNGQSLFPAFKDLGVTAVQTDLSWNQIAPTRPANPSDPNDPAYKWPSDSVVQQAQAYGMKVLFILDFAPPWANGDKPPNGFPLDPNDFAAFAMAASRRYPTVKLWQVYGEPALHTHFDEITPEIPGKPLNAGQKKAVRKYAVLLNTTYDALKSVDPNNIVIGGNTHSYSEIRPVTWVRNLKLPNGQRPKMDVFGHNPFTYRVPNLKNPPTKDGVIQIDDLPILQRAINKYLAKPLHHKIPIWLGEYSIPTNKDDFFFNYWVSPRTQALFVQKGLAIARKLPGVMSFGWGMLRDDPSLKLYSGLENGDGSPKPAYFAFKNG